MNIVLEDNDLRMVSFDKDINYGFDDLTFYIPIQYLNIVPILIVKQEDTYDVIKLKQVSGTNKAYNCFVCELTPIKINTGECGISLLILSAGNERTDVLISTPFIFLSVKNDDYNFRYQIYAIEQTNRSVSSMYESIVNLYGKIIEISKLNIEACSKQKKGG